MITIYEFMNSCYIIKVLINNKLFQGHDTTAAGSSFTLCVLGIHKDIQVNK